jgi:hypothetical protein
LGPTSELRGPWVDGYLFSLSGPIYAGTNEVQHNVIAERILGLPRETRPDSRPENRPENRPEKEA